MSIASPDDELGIVDAVCAAFAAREALWVQGAGSKAGMLRPVQAARALSVAGYCGITLYSPGELVISARAGTTMGAVHAALAASGQQMIAEPPDYGRLLGSDSEQTLGGVVAANLSGPRRVAGGAVRDHVLGVRAVNGTGELLRGGGRVLKNVTGLDMCKPLTGSHGTLAVLTEVTLKVLPAAETSCSVVVRGIGAEDGVRALSAALGSPFGVSGAAYVPAGAAGMMGEDGALAVVRVEDFADAAAYKAQRLVGVVGAFGAAEIWARERSAAAWSGIRDAAILPVAQGDAVWRVSVRPSAGPAVLAAAQAAGVDGFLDWGGGLALLAGPADDARHAAITRAVRALGGIWTVLRGPAAWRAGIDVVPAEVPALAALTRRVKAAMDPAGILNPGRIFAGV